MVSVLRAKFITKEKQCPFINVDEYSVAEVLLPAVTLVNTGALRIVDKLAVVIRIFFIQLVVVSKHLVYVRTLWYKWILHENSVKKSLYNEVNIEAETQIQKHYSHN